MTAAIPSSWDRTVDVLVLGSGAAGLSAAVAAHDGGAETLVLEKAPLIGGTAGVSGGIIWIPLNRHMAAAGISDSREEALEYIRRLTLGSEPDPALLETYVDRAHEVAAYLEDNTPLRLMVSSSFTDYYADLPGGKPEGGRSLESEPFDARAQLGADAPKVRTSPHLAWLTLDEGAKALIGGDVPADLAAQRERDDVRVIGSALVASLYRGLIDRGVEVVTGARADELVRDDDGAIVGAVVEQGGARRAIGARRGVVIATGGFEWNPELVKAFIGEPLEPMSPPHNEGDGLRMAMEAGAALGNMRAFWGQPALLDPDAEFEGERMIEMGGARAIPGVVVVNRHGERFVNEAVSYQDFPKAVAAFDPVRVEHPNHDHWMVYDQRLKDSAAILPSMPAGEPAPDWVHRGETIRELAEDAGIDPDGLEATIARWNEHAAAGADPDFGRGSAWYEAFMTGGPTPAVLQPVEQGPFYAMRMFHGALGTNGGPRITADGEVRNLRGGVIEGLYAAGNAAACPLGDSYPGGGATLGPALTFGFIAGSHAARRGAAS
ncbi:MAG: FAD-dependent oxidoreductase [Solirubrobacterales bacterium]|nr:FAD-dependent oxidoreductase [Solirubrobacterales bacterium]